MTGVRTTAARRDDADGGFTLIELVTAMAVFSVLMVMVGAITLSGFSSIREITSRSEIQQESQNAAEWATRLLRYTDLPEGQTAAITAASPSAIRFFTYSGTGPKNDVPYEAHLFVVANADGTSSLVSDVWTPTAVTGGWTWNETPARRELLRVPAGVGTPLSVRVFACNTLTGCDTREEVTPGAYGPVTLAEGRVLESVEFAIGDPADSRNRVTQQVRLVNLS
jgi:prepilin-type N-terminal cleavage/methylation domain-containing protein